MKRKLLPTSYFLRSVKQKVKKNPSLAGKIQTTLLALSSDAFHPSLKTHKLKGKLRGSWACSVDYDLRIIFEFVKHEEDEAILLETVGTHDEVY